jgi:hypothetical protein
MSELLSIHDLQLLLLLMGSTGNLYIQMQLMTRRKLPRLLTHQTFLTRNLTQPQMRTIRKLGTNPIEIKQHGIS